MSTAYLEVHVAEEVLETLNVDHCHELVAVGLGDESAGDTCYGSLYRYACVHECERGAAYRALRCGAVGGEYLGYETERIGEFLNRGDNGSKSSLCERTVTNLAASGSAAGLCLANGVAREVVLVHISLGVFLVETVDALSVAYRSESSDSEHLCLTSCEET